MCTALVRYRPGNEWPVLLAFVRDESRLRPTVAPGAWWPLQPNVIGGRDERAGGTWLAVDIAAGRIAFLLNRLEPGLPAPMSGVGPSRGSVPIDALAAGRDLDPERDITTLAGMAPFHLMVLDRFAAPRHWRWHEQLDQELLAPGTSVIASRGLALPGEPERHARLVERVEAAGDPAAFGADATPAEAWGPWLELLDGRDAQPDDLGGLTVHSVGEHPDFGTVGASLVALAMDGRVRYDVNHAHDLDPARWQQVDVSRRRAAPA